jgi:RNA polymerase sigma-70 factor (ECF subfamily)
VGNPDVRETKLRRVIEAFRLRPSDIVRVARRIAHDLGVPGVSRFHLTRLAKGPSNASESLIFIITAAIQELTGAALRAGDLFDVEPEFARSRLVAHVPGANGSNLSFPPSQAAELLSRIRRPLVPQETGVSDEEFEELYREYGVLLAKIAARRFGIPPDDAEAIVHDTFVAYLQRQTYVRDVKAWLYGTVRNRSVDYLRQRKRECPLLPEHDEMVDEAAESAQKQWLRNLTASAVIARLGEKCREALRGHYFRDEKRSALANRLSTTPGNIDQLISICKRRAAEMFRNLTLKGK